MIPLFLPEFCSNGIPGIQTGLSCCQAACGRCGGDGCHLLGGGLGSENCCQGTIEREGERCSDKGAAPCVVDGEHHQQSVSVCENTLGAAEALKSSANVRGAVLLLQTKHEEPTCSQQMPSFTSLFGGNLETQVMPFHMVHPTPKQLTRDRLRYILENELDIQRNCTSLSVAWPHR